MEQRIRDRFHNGILAETADRFDLTVDNFHVLDGFESFIYEFERDGQALILRVGHSLRRNEALIQGEVDWINYLAEGGLPVARAIRSPNGKFVEVVEDGQGGQFLATAFVKVYGQSFWKAGWTPALFETYGRLIGSLHARTKGYQPVHPAWKRPEWDDELFEFVEHFLPATEDVARQKYRAMLDYLHNLPKGIDDYGLIHQDAHGSNLLVDQAGWLTLFDFDDCAYSWFINDIAIVLFYIAVDADDPPAFTRNFMTHFLRGYRACNRLNPTWLKEIPYFLKLREIEMYAVIHRDFDINNIDNAWCAGFMQQRKRKIEQDVPFIDFDFESFFWSNDRS
jgi:amicoumacin kinase